LLGFTDGGLDEGFKLGASEGRGLEMPEGEVDATGQDVKDSAIVKTLHVSPIVRWAAMEPF
jgi:hypothetical protein